MPRAKHLSAFPTLYWDLFQRAVQQGEFDFRHPPEDVRRFRDDLYSFQMSLRKLKHPEADRYSQVQIELEPIEGGNRQKGPFSGRILLRLRDRDPRLASLRSALNEGEGQSTLDRTQEPSAPQEDYSYTPGSQESHDALDAALSRLYHTNEENEDGQT